MITRIIDIPGKHSFFLFGPRQTGKSTLINAYLEGKESWKIDLLQSAVLMPYLKEPSLFRKEASFASVGFHVSLTLLPSSAAKW